MPSDPIHDRFRLRDPDHTPAELTHSMQLVRKAQDGQGEALDELFRRYENQIYRMARIRMGARIRTFMDSSDLVQNTYMVAMRKIDTLELRSHSSIIQWLSKIVENQIRDAARYARAQRRDRDREVRVDGERSALHPVAAEPIPSETVSDRELVSIYDECVGMLEGDAREVILLRDYAGMSWERITEDLGRPTSRATQQLYQRARIKLSLVVNERIDLGEGEREDA